MKNPEKPIEQPSNTDNFQTKFPRAYESLTELSFNIFKVLYPRFQEDLKIQEQEQRQEQESNSTILYLVDSYIGNSVFTKMEERFTVADREDIRIGRGSTETPTSRSTEKKVRYVIRILGKYFYAVVTLSQNEGGSFCIKMSNMVMDIPDSTALHTSNSVRYVFPFDLETTLTRGGDNQFTPSLKIKVDERQQPEFQKLLDLPGAIGDSCTTCVGSLGDLLDRNFPNKEGSLRFSPKRIDVETESAKTFFQSDHKKLDFTSQNDLCIVREDSESYPYIVRDYGQVLTEETLNGLTDGQETIIKTSGLYNSSSFQPYVIRLSKSSIDSGGKRSELVCVEVFHESALTQSREVGVEVAYLKKDDINGWKCVCTFFAILRRPNNRNSSPSSSSTLRITHVTKGGKPFNPNIIAFQKQEERCLLYGNFLLGKLLREHDGFKKIFEALSSIVSSPLKTSSLGEETGEQNLFDLLRKNFEFDFGIAIPSESGGFSPLPELELVGAPVLASGEVVELPETDLYSQVKSRIAEININPELMNSLLRSIPQREDLDINTNTQFRKIILVFIDFLEFLISFGKRDPDLNLVAKHDAFIQILLREMSRVKAANGFYLLSVMFYAYVYVNKSPDIRLEEFYDPYNHVQDYFSHPGNLGNFLLQVVGSAFYAPYVGNFGISES